MHSITNNQIINPFIKKKSLYKNKYFHYEKLFYKQ